MADFIIVQEPNIPQVLEVMTGIQGPPGAAGGVSFFKEAYENVGGQRIVVLNSDDKIGYASSDNINHIGIVVGMTKTAAIIGDTVEVVNNIIIEDVSWSLEPYKPVFLSTNGIITQNIEGAILFVLSVGVALSPTKIYLKQSQPIRRQNG